MPKIRRERKLNRCREIDYNADGFYFVTICVKDRMPVFGKVVDEGMALNRFGKIVDDFWQKIPRYYHGVEIDDFIIMPDHIHGIININKNDFCETSISVGTAPVGTAPVGTAPVGTEQCSVPTNTNTNTKNYGLLSKIIKSFKDVVVKENNKMKFCQNFSWQRSFYDRVIFDQKSLQKTREYISNNPFA